VVFPAGEETIFQPGGLHVMLIGLHQYLNVGDSFTVTLVMEKAGEISLNVVVKEP
jgi:copper(I)-binding protein